MIKSEVKKHVFTSFELFIYVIVIATVISAGISAFYLDLIVDLLNTISTSLNLE